MRDALAKAGFGASVAVGGWLIYRLITGDGIESGILLAYVVLMMWGLLRREREKLEEAIADPSTTLRVNGEPEEIILNIIREKDRAKRADLLPHVDISKSSLVRLLDKLESSGKIMQIGERKASFYTLKQG